MTQYGNEASLKLLHKIHNKHMVHFLQELIFNRCFTLHNGKDTSNRHPLKNGVPQGSVLAPLLFNIYTSDLPLTTSKKYMYADNITLMITGKNFKNLEQGLTKDLTTMNAYFHKWRLKLNITKTVSSTFHFTNKLTKTTLNVKCGTKSILFKSHSKYLGVTLDLTLTYKTHLTQLVAKVQACNNLLC
ncbi:hypothetical protein Y1Q_0011832 [Alligator mississippiensis]|uniref:Reverse transcriptase domain-containing protein n=1 Tax=Alligator mississippiensis TaxID=8496 RepID=A0A151LYL1_ALLMI|nr:hypothetical protein Y1Q_0011832 [Alligator mississippiensis]